MDREKESEHRFPRDQLKSMLDTDTQPSKATLFDEEAELMLEVEKEETISSPKH
jgi:hypothetical protein